MSEGSYIRGGGGVAVDAGLVGRILAWGVVVVLGACALWQAASTVSDHSQAARLHRSGVMVQITVTGCSAVSSGIGMGIEYYRCEGTYTLNGQRLAGLIHGSQGLLPTGSVVTGRVVPSDPTTLTRTGPGSSSAPGTSVGSYSVSIILGALAVLGAAALLIWRLRGRSRPSRPIGAPVA